MEQVYYKKQALLAEAGLDVIAPILLTRIVLRILPSDCATESPTFTAKNPSLDTGHVPYKQAKNEQSPCSPESSFFPYNAEFVSMFDLTVADGNTNTTFTKKEST